MAQKTKPKTQEVEGPPAPVTTAPIQMTASQLAARLSRAKTDAELESALRSTMNYIDSLSPEMTKEDYKQNRALHKQLAAVVAAQEEAELQPKLAYECFTRLGDILEKKEYVGPKTPEEAEAGKTEKPMQFQQFGFFQLADIMGKGSVAFGALPSEQAIYIPEDQQGAALQALNKLANAYVSGGNTAKAGKAYLSFIEGLANDRWGKGTQEAKDMVCNIISAGPGAGCSQAKQALRSGNYWSLFNEAANPMSEWRRTGSDNYLTFTYNEVKLVVSAEAAKYIVRGPKGEIGIDVKGTVHEEIMRSVRVGEPGQWGREEEKKYLPGGGAGVYGEVGPEDKRWKAGGRVGAEYIPGEQGGWFIPVELFGEVTGGTDATSQTVRLQVKASPEVTGRILNLEGGVIWNGLFFTKGESNAFGYVFGARAARMSVDADGNTWVDLVIEGQLGPTFQKIFKEKGVMMWAGIAGIVQREIPEGVGVEGPLEPQTKVGAGVEIGAKGEKVEGSLQIQLNPIAVTPAQDFTGREEQGQFAGVMVVGTIRF